MPAISPRLTRLSMYPDTSTLAYAFDGLALDASPGQRELATLIQEVARQANLCLSFAHLVEFIFNVEKRDVRLARAHWLDSLDVVWMHDLEKVLEMELERVLRRAAGLSTDSRSLPAASSLLSTFQGLTPGHVAELISDCSVTRLVQTVGNDESTRHQLASLSALGPKYNRRLFFDRRAAQDELSDAELRMALHAKVDQILLEDAVETNHRLAEQDQDYRIKKGSLWVVPDDDFVRSALRPHAAAPNDFPLTFTFQEVLRNVGSGLALKEDINTNFFTSKNREGDIFDWWHLVGAAYCDAFACDKYTSRCLADVRKRINRSKEVVFRSGDYFRLAQDLRTSMQM